MIIEKYPINKVELSGSRKGSAIKIGGQADRRTGEQGDQQRSPYRLVTAD